MLANLQQRLQQSTEQSDTALSTDDWKSALEAQSVLTAGHKVSAEAARCPVLGPFPTAAL